MDDTSTVTDEGTLETPQRIELSELTDEVRPLAKRYAEQEKGSLTETVRQALDAFVEDPEQGLKVFDELDPRVLERVLKKKGITREELVNKFKPQAQSQDSIESQIEAYLQKTTTKNAKASVETKLSELPEWIRELAQAEFAELIEWRTLSKEQLEKMADKAVNLARVNSGSIEKYARLNLGSQSIAGGNAGTKKENSLLDSSNDPFWKQFSK